MINVFIFTRFFAEIHLTQNILYTFQFFRRRGIVTLLDFSLGIDGSLFNNLLRGLVFSSQGKSNLVNIEGTGNWGIGYFPKPSQFSSEPSPPSEYEIMSHLTPIRAPSPSIIPPARL